MMMDSDKSESPDNPEAESDPVSVSVRESAQRLGVSVATIRNWIKAGCLASAGRGLVTLASLGHFQAEISGKKKLNKRANKSQKNTHEHEQAASVFIERAQSMTSTGGETLLGIGEDYESNLTDSYRNKEGIYYTPPALIDDLFLPPTEDVDYSTASFCDPCCGSGNFIVRAIELGFKPQNIYGFDVDPVAVEITKARIYELTGYKNPPIVLGNFLEIASLEGSPCYDYIYTNPPWGKKLPKAEKIALGEQFGAGTSVDTCSLFFFACLECLTSSGRLGMLLPSAFFNISSFENARRKALELKIERLADYGKAFKGLLTTAQGIVLTNTPTDGNSDGNRIVRCESAGKVSERSARSFRSNPKSILNLNCDHESAETLEYLFSLPHITLAEQATWGLGVVTGNNEKFIRDSPADDYIPVFRGSDISPKGLKPPSCYIPDDLHIYQQAAPRSLFQSKEKLIYKFISSRLCFYHDTEQRYLLNSANMLIPNVDLPVPTKVLGELLSSDFMNWVFSSIFDTHKILRSDLEALPIHAHFLKDLTHFDEDHYLEQLCLERAKGGSYQAVV